jgi:hypothetical protein
MNGPEGSGALLETGGGGGGDGIEVGGSDTAMMRPAAAYQPTTASRERMASRTLAISA